MNETPKGLRLHIGVFGRRNAGKSSLLNALTGQPVSIVSDFPGTTTDPVEKALELAPVGPALFIDTAGTDDEGALGSLRRERTLAVAERADLALLVTEPGVWGPFEEELAALFAERKVPWLAVVNKSDLAGQGEVARETGQGADREADWAPDRVAARTTASAAMPEALKATGARVLAVSALTGAGIARLKEALAELAPEDWFEPPRLLGDLLPPGEMAVLVVPIDLGAPKGRLILPQVQAIRDALDSDACCLVAKERELSSVLARLNRKPALVVCDSQVVLKAAGDTPPDIPLTTFSILMARFKGDLPRLARGAAAIPALKSGDRVLIAEGCAHHPLADDIGRVKIPRWLRQYAGGDIRTETVAGAAFPEDLSPYALVIHCGACTTNRRSMLARLFRAESQGAPMTNYGVAISLVQGVLPRVLAPFPAALAAYEREIRERASAHGSGPGG